MSRLCDRCGTDEYLCNVYDGETVCDNCCEKAYERQQEKLMEDGPPDTSAQDQQIEDAGRGHLLRYQSKKWVLLNPDDAHSPRWKRFDPENE